mmetsp:Transcript_7200/g.10708  ORF Transcript_7200/g.10708 Transcript_7200/m.10708 type:complete len:366 (+) Transcript_7200:22-1119(+)
MTSFTKWALTAGGLCLFASAELSDEFSLWAKRHGKVYEDEKARISAFNTWTTNLKIVEAINSANLTWTATIDNKFGDITQDEFAAKYLLPRSSSESVSSAVHSKSSKTSTRRIHKRAETSFDWREHGAVTPVHDQGSVGTCWAFSTIGNVEGQWFLSTGELVDLSEEFLVDCDGSHDETHADCSVFGGWPYLAYDFLISAGGVPTEDADPYCSGTGDCYPCMQGPVSLCGPPPYYCDESITAECPNVPRYATISSWEDIPQDEDQIADSLVSVGPLSALLDATGLQHYKEGIWSGHAPGVPDILGCSSSYLDHAVLLTGFGEDGGNSYWSVKNSWGDRWGEEGYFRIARGDGTCGINTAVTTSFH